MDDENAKRLELAREFDYVLRDLDTKHHFSWAWLYRDDGTEWYPNDWNVHRVSDRFRHQIRSNWHVASRIVKSPGVFKWSDALTDYLILARALHDDIFVVAMAHYRNHLPRVIEASDELAMCDTVFGSGKGDSLFDSARCHQPWARKRRGLAAFLECKTYAEDSKRRREPEQLYRHLLETGLIDMRAEVPSCSYLATVFEQVRTDKEGTAAMKTLLVDGKQPEGTYFPEL